MKLSTRKFKLIMVFLIVFISGCFFGLFGASYLYYKHVFSKAMAQNVQDLSWQIIAVSKLRLGETADAINLLETQIDGNILAIAQMSNLSETDYCYRVLRTAKTYREIYPSNSRKPFRIANALSEIPKLETFECENSLCRLVKQVQSQK